MKRSTPSRSASSLSWADFSPGLPFYPAHSSSSILPLSSPFTSMVSMITKTAAITNPVPQSAKKHPKPERSINAKLSPTGILLKKWIEATMHPTVPPMEKIMLSASYMRHLVNSFTRNPPFISWCIKMVTSILLGYILMISFNIFFYNKKDLRFYLNLFCCFYLSYLFWLTMIFRFNLYVIFIIFESYILITYKF